MSGGAPGATAPHSPALLALGRLALVVSGFGFPLTQVLIERFGRRGAIVAEGVAAGLLIRDTTLVAMGTPRRLRPWPGALLWLELIAAVAATVAGLAAVARPGQAVDRTWAGRVEAVRRLTVGLLFGLHTYRFGIYLRPERGLASAANEGRGPSSAPERCGMRHWPPGGRWGLAGWRPTQGWRTICLSRTGGAPASSCPGGRGR